MKAATSHAPSHTTGITAGSENETIDLHAFIHSIDLWIEQLLAAHKHEQISYSTLSPSLNSYFPDDFLASSFFVVVDGEVPVPLPDLKAAERLRSFFTGNDDYYPAIAITYKNTCFIKREHLDDISLHFHELVHVQQWCILGSKHFLALYLEGLFSGVLYKDMPLEKMAYELEFRFIRKEPIPNLLESIRLELESMASKEPVNAQPKAW